MIERSLPKPCRSARDWAKDFEKHNKTLINKNDPDNTGNTNTTNTINKEKIWILKH